MTALSGSVLSFAAGKIRLDANARTLTVGGQAAKLGGRAFDLLDALVARRDRVVPKQELLDVVWPGLVVEENNIQVHVVTLRKLLGPEAIATVAGRGYRFTLEPDAVAQFTPRPTSAHALIGRDALIAEAIAVMREPDTRLVTLTGPGGAGKTRVGLRLAAELAHDYADGSYVVMLAPVRDTAHVASAIASVLNVQEAGGKSALDLVTAYLRERELLLMLDNLEHLSGAVSVVVHLLASCPRIRTMVTSRTLLHIADERAIMVPPLGLPRRAAAIDELARAPAVSLFLERSRVVGCEVDRRSAADIAAVAEICRRLDGLPLAIELAAARLRVLSPRALRDRLGKGFDLLKADSEDTPARQRTLRQAIEWSHALLSDAGRALLRRLAVFAGGWSLDAAEALCAGAEPTIDVLDAMTELMDHSLVQRVEDVDGEPRFAILETVREFAQDQLGASDETTDARSRHAAYFLELASTADPHLKSAHRRAWLHRLAADHNNLRMALSWYVVEHADRERAIELVGALAWYWYFCAQFGEGRGWINLALGLVDAQRRDAPIAQVLSGAARLAVYSGDVDRAIELAGRSVDIWRSIGDRRELGYALAHEAIARIVLGQRETARALLHESRELFLALNDAWGVAFATTYEGISLVFEPGMEAEGYPLLSEGRARFLALDDDWGVTTSSHYLGSIALRNADYEAARELTEEMLASARELGDNYRIARNLHQLAEIAFAERDLPQARRHLVDGMRLNRDQGRFGDIVQQLRLLGRIDALDSRVGAAARLFGAASARDERNRTLPQDDSAENEKVIASLREALGERRFTNEWTQGAAMSLDEAVRWVLEADRTANASH